MRAYLRGFDGGHFYVWDVSVVTVPERSEGRVSDTPLCRCLESRSHGGSKNELKMFGEEARVTQGARFQVFGSFRL